MTERAFDRHEFDIALSFANKYFLRVPRNEQISKIVLCAKYSVNEIFDVLFRGINSDPDKLYKDIYTALQRCRDEYRDSFFVEISDKTVELLGLKDIKSDNFMVFTDKLLGISGEKQQYYIRKIAIKAHSCRKFNVASRYYCYVKPDVIETPDKKPEGDVITQSWIYWHKMLCENECVDNEELAEKRIDISENKNCEQAIYNLLKFESAEYLALLGKQINLSNENNRQIKRRKERNSVRLSNLTLLVIVLVSWGLAAAHLLLYFNVETYSKLFYGFSYLIYGKDIAIYAIVIPIAVILGVAGLCSFIALFFRCKKRMSVLSLEVVMMVVLCFAVGAGLKDTYKFKVPHSDSYNGFLYTLDENMQITLTSYSVDEKEVVIPSEIEGRQVVGIGTAFRDNKNVEKIYIPDSVTSIGSSAFENCTSLTSVTIPDSVTSIGDEAFKNCNSLTSITIPGGVMSVGYSAFYGCELLAEITMPDNVTSIGDEAFLCCSSLTSITIPNGITRIGNYMFFNCSSLKSIVMADSVTSIGYRAFEGCESLMDITMSDGAKSIGDGAFCNCSSLTSITIPDGVTSIGNSAFANCINLKEVYINNIEAWCQIEFNDFESKRSLMEWRV